MKKYWIVSLLLISGLLSKAQKGLDEMIAAEKAFAAYSVANNTRDAFLKFMDTTAIMFRNGESYKSYEVWQKREKRSGFLHWWPRYAEISSSGDFGWTAGPWVFHPQTINDSAIGNGYFFTVWKKNSAGEWKFILDVGTDTGPEAKKTDVTILNNEKNKGTDFELHMAEQAFNSKHKVDEEKAYDEFASAQMINASKDEVLKNSTAKPKPTAGKKPSFASQGRGISSAGDLGYTYGNVIGNDIKETYLRIWRHEPSGWKIVLQLIRL